MNVDIRDQLLAEGFRQEQLLQEDWETMKKELTDLYVAGKITERQVQTRLSRAGMGPVAAHAAHKIAVENAQQREANIAKAKEAQERLERAREITTRRPGPKRGELAQAYCNEWNKKFGHIVKAGVVRESLKNAFENINVVCEDKYIDDYFVNLCEEVNIIGDTKMTEKELTKIFEDTLTEAFSLEKIKSAVAQAKENRDKALNKKIIDRINAEAEKAKRTAERDTAKAKREIARYSERADKKAEREAAREAARAGRAEAVAKIKKAAKKTALGVAAAGALAAAPGVVAGAKNVSSQRDARVMDKAGAQYNKAQNDARRAEVEKKIRDAGIQMGKDAKDTAADLKGRAEMEAPFAKKKAKDLANKAKEKIKEGTKKIKDRFEEAKSKKTDNGAVTCSVKTTPNYFPY